MEREEVGGGGQPKPITDGPAFLTCAAVGPTPTTVQVPFRQSEWWRRRTGEGRGGEAASGRAEEEKVLTARRAKTAPPPPPNTTPHHERERETDRERGVYMRQF